MIYNALVDSDDIIFTINKTLDPTLKSSQRANWDGVLIEKINDLAVRFTLARPYAPFLQNTTIGEGQWLKPIFQLGITIQMVLRAMQVIP